MAKRLVAAAVGRLVDLAVPAQPAHRHPITAGTGSVAVDRLVGHVEPPTPRHPSSARPASSHVNAARAAA